MDRVERDASVVEHLEFVRPRHRLHLVRAPVPTFPAEQEQGPVQPPQRVLGTVRRVHDRRGVELHGELHGELSHERAAEAGADRVRIEVDRVCLDRRPDEFVGEARACVRHVEGGA